jgi:hypothetical protein
MAPTPLTRQIFGGVHPQRGPKDPATRRLLDLLADGQVWVTLSAPSGSRPSRTTPTSPPSPEP